MKQDVNLIDKRACDALDEIDDLAQYVRRDCLEISGIKPSENCKAEDIVKSVGEAMGIRLNESDISIAHPLPTLKKDSPKIIVKFTQRKRRNQFYINRKKLAKVKAKDLSHLNFVTSSGSAAKIFISESLTPKRKKLFGEINQAKKRLKWRFIWSFNGKIFLKKKEDF